MARRGTIANIDLRELERLCALQPTDEEIAAFFDVSTRTIERRRRNPAFAEVMAGGGEGPPLGSPDADENAGAG